MGLKVIKANTALKQGLGHAKILIWGHSGTGKTWLASTSPKCLVVLTEANGMVSVANSNNDADVIIVTTAKELYDLISSIQKGEAKQYKTIVFDSLTEIQRLFKLDVLNGKGSENMNFKDWGKLADRMLGFIRMCRDLPFHIVCTALRTETYNDDGAIISVGPSFEGRKTGNEVMQYFSAVGAISCQLDSDGIEQRSVHFTANKIMMVKPCHPITGQINSPNMTKIINAICENSTDKLNTKSNSKK